MCLDRPSVPCITLKLPSSSTLNQDEVELKAALALVSEVGLVEVSYKDQLRTEGIAS